ncbi:hypothetical protein PAPYR_8396 [Paratrimastix pyriformis]|uniref:Uncharacterized protein n=1 Tax=Paratrimastix pyriformis TaxID=342808 RepID=A0ABQ8UAM6_9EUKA|nr:hypothetical protein PAPYR_8396 [Paratrimastix pyriformis]
MLMELLPAKTFTLPPPPQPGKKSRSQAEGSIIGAVAAGLQADEDLEFFGALVGHLCALALCDPVMAATTAAPTPSPLARKAFEILKLAVVARTSAIHVLLHVPPSAPALDDGLLRSKFLQFATELALSQWGGFCHFSTIVRNTNCTEICVTLGNVSLRVPGTVSQRGVPSGDPSSSSFSSAVAKKSTIFRAI